MQRTHVNPIYKDTITFRKTAAEAGGQYAEYELTVLPQGGNLPHFHHAFAETFTAIEGRLGLKLGNETRLLEPGESYTVPIGAVHNFFNSGTDEIRCLITFKPGHQGFENAIRIGYGLARDGKTDRKGTPKNLLALALLMDMSDTYMSGVLALLSPVFRLLAARARRNGLEQQLMETYCRDVLAHTDVR